MEGVKLSQCDFVAVAHGVYAEHCLQMNVNNSHINATHCCIYACNVNQSSFSNLLLYKVAAVPRAAAANVMSEGVQIVATLYTQHCMARKRF